MTKSIVTKFALALLLAFACPQVSRAAYTYATSVTLAQLASKIMTEGDAYGSMPGQFGGDYETGNFVITNDLICERVIQVNGEYFMLCHDDGTSIPKQWNSTRESVAWAQEYYGEDGVFFYQKPETYTRYNWIMLKVRAGFGEVSFINMGGKKITGGTIAGHLNINETFDIILDCTSEEALSYGFEQVDEQSTQLNTYNIANFNYSDGHYCNKNLLEVATFLMVPKPLEVAQIHWATYDAANKKFIIPSSEGANKYGLQGEANANFDYMQSGSEADFTDGETYEFTALIKTNAEPEDGVEQAVPRRRASSKSSVSIPLIEQHDFYLNYYEVCPLEIPKVTTAVNDVKAEGNVVGITYYNLAGMASATPWQGVNIEVQNLDNGQTIVKKWINQQ